MVDPIQQLLAEAREKQILDAAATVFAAKGFQAATIRDIAQEAGIADGTIYNYFDNKAALLLGIFKRLRSTVLQSAPPAQPGAGDLRATVRTLLSHPLTAPEDDDFALLRIVLSEIMVDETLRRRYYDEILAPTLAIADEQLAAQAAAQGVRLSQEDARLVVRAIGGMVMGLMMEHIMGDETVRARWRDLPGFLADLIAGGLQATAE